MGQGSDRQKFHLCLAYTDSCNNFSISKIILMVHFFIPKKPRFSYLNLLSTSRVYSKSNQLCHSIECFLLGSQYPYNSEFSGKNINNQDSIKCSFSSTCLVTHTKFYGKLHNPRYSSTMRMRKKIFKF